MSTPMTRDEFMLKIGFHKHKPSYRGKDLYFQVGGAGVTKEQANSIYNAFNTAVKQKLIDEWEHLDADGDEASRVLYWYVDDKGRYCEITRAERIAQIEASNA